MPVACGHCGFLLIFGAGAGGAGEAKDFRQNRK
jgi:hypothetical protein